MTVLFDNSVWQRMRQQAVHREVTEISNAHTIALSLPQALELGHSLRDPREYDTAFDILIAAIAHRHGATVVHYDKNFATIGEILEGFPQRWIAPPGTLD